VSVVPEFGTVNVADKEVILEAGALKCTQQKLDTVVKVWLLCSKGWGICTELHALVNRIPDEVCSGAGEEEPCSHFDWIDGLCVKDGLASCMQSLCDSCSKGVTEVFGGIPEVHLCSLLGGGKASLLWFGVPIDLAFEDSHVRSDDSCSGTAGIK